MKNTKNIIIFSLVLITIIVAFTIIFTSIKKDKSSVEEVEIYFLKTCSIKECKLSVVKRMIPVDKNSIQTAISELLKGPGEDEKQQGYFTEIPQNTKLIELKESPEKIIINLSQEFETGGGSSSMELRLEQLLYTVLNTVGKKPVYLEIEGNQIDYMGGEGVTVPQPLSLPE